MSLPPFSSDHWSDPLRLLFWRIAASGVLPARWFSPPVPGPDSRAAKTGKLQIEIVSHCWNYSHFLVYQLSSLALSPPTRAEVTMTVFYCEEDQRTRELLEHFSGVHVEGVTWNWQKLPKGLLFRRAVGRNQAALATRADWIWFTDCDTLFRQGCLDHLSDRLRATDVRAQLRTVAQTMPTAVIMLDLGAEQLAESSTISVTNVLYWKLLQQVGYSKEKKLAELEFTLDERGLFADFQTAYQQRFNGKWLAIHNNPMMGIARAAQLLPQFLPAEFPTPESFTNLKFEMAEDIRDLAQRMITLARRHSGQQNILFLIDEAGQYVAPRSELILNLDGLAKNIRKIGNGHVWVIATAQQTLTEDDPRAHMNTAKLFKLKPKFHK